MLYGGNVSELGWQKKAMVLKHFKVDLILKIDKKNFRAELDRLSASTLLGL